MGLIERRYQLMRQIENIDDEQTLEMLEDSIAYYSQNSKKDITDDLDSQQLAELTKLFNEPAEKDVISEAEFNKLFDRWNTK